jgi:dynein heavy chain
MYLENIFSGQDIRRQLQNEANLFDSCDKNLKTLFVKLRVNASALRAIKVPNILETLQKTLDNLEIVERELEDYLEVKRGLFPRFYFISNDELLEILAKAQNVEAVQKHLRKCFENISRLDLKLEGRSYLIAGMISAEGENVQFNKATLQARG